MKLTSVVLLCMLLVCAVTHAATIAQVSGPTFIAAGIGSGNGQQAGAVGFSTTNALTNITITAPISVLTQPTAIDAYLTHKIGPGTTQADVLGHTQVTVPVNTSNPNNYQFTTTTFFSNLSLAPGNYYVSLIETDGTNNAGVGQVLNGSQTFTFAPGAAFLGTFGTSQQSGTFAPGFSYSNLEQATLFGGDLAFTVTGTVVPEPVSAVAMGVLLLMTSRRRHRRIV